MKCPKCNIVVSHHAIDMDIYDNEVQISLYCENCVESFWGFLSEDDFITEAELEVEKNTAIRAALKHL